MKCYVCAKQGVDEDAVAICIVCGMGLCLGHAFKEELLVQGYHRLGVWRGTDRLSPYLASVHLRGVQAGH